MSHWGCVLFVTAGRLDQYVRKWSASVLLNWQSSSWPNWLSLKSGVRKIPQFDWTDAFLLWIGWSGPPVFHIYMVSALRLLVVMSREFIQIFNERKNEIIIIITLIFNNYSTKAHWIWNRELKHATFLSHERQPELITKPRVDVTRDRPQVTDVKTEVLPSLMKLQKRRKISWLYEH